MHQSTCPAWNLLLVSHPLAEGGKKRHQGTKNKQTNKNTQWQGKREPQIWTLLWKSNTEKEMHQSPDWKKINPEWIVSIKEGKKIFINYILREILKVFMSLSQDSKSTFIHTNYSNKCRWVKMSLLETKTLIGLKKKVFITFTGSTVINSTGSGFESWLQYLLMIYEIKLK